MADVAESSISAEKLEQLRDTDRIVEIQSVLKVIANNMAMPLYMAFWISDIIYVPHLMWEFLIVRLGIIPLSVAIQVLSRRAKTFMQAQLMALLFNFGMSGAINYMIFRIHEPATPYYAGLNLIALGNLAFIPWSRKFYLLVACTIFVPFFVITLLQSHSNADLIGLFLNSFFIFSTIIMLFYTRMFNERLRQKELASRLALNNEVSNRDRIIEIKSQEAIKLAALSRQFSPQVVSAIRNSKINLSDSVRRVNICAIFIDIVNSTDRVVRVDKDKVHKVVSMFMEDVIRTLLKFDITIDKFLGDGILAFSNDPVKYPDFIERVVKAAVEIKEKIDLKQDLYENFWLSKFSLRTGIASGYANVGFYGNDRYYKSYTAIGPVVNLACRLCSVAQPDGILVTNDVASRLNPEAYHIESLGKMTLKGFESDIIKVFEIRSKFNEEIPHDEIDCPVCPTGTLFLDNDENGLFVFRCRDCGHIQDNRLDPSILKKMAG